MTVWLRDWSAGGEVSVRLLCIPGLASNAHIYRPWARLLPSSIGVLGVELPGHGARMDEPPATELSELADGPLLEEVAALADRPLVIFGHSMGALVGLELGRRISERLPFRPALFVAAGSDGPQSRKPVPDPDRMTDAEVSQFLVAWGGTSAEVLGDPDYARLLLRLVRAELAMLRRYRFTPGQPLGCPVRAYIGADDPLVTIADAQGWCLTGEGETEVRTFSGGHFFFQTDEAAVLRQLQADLDAAVRNLAQPHLPPRKQHDGDAGRRAS